MGCRTAARAHAYMYARKHRKSMPRPNALPSRTAHRMMNFTGILNLTSVGFPLTKPGRNWGNRRTTLKASASRRRSKGSSITGSFIQPSFPTVKLTSTVPCIPASLQIGGYLVWLETNLTISNSVHLTTSAASSWRQDDQAGRMVILDDVQEHNWVHNSTANNEVKR